MSSHTPPGTLYVVATPIGNLEDLTVRARRVLSEVSIIACEDTRHTRRLLAHIGVTTQVTSYHDHNEAPRTEELMRYLGRGEDVALVSDAGTPAVSDPGFTLIRAASEAGIPVVPIPGPSAVLAALTASGLPMERFTFLGYLPRQSTQRKRALEEISRLPWTMVVFEAPHRITATLQDMQAVLGDRRVALARELTKKFEEIYRGTVSGALEHLRIHAPRGEFTIVVEGVARAPGEALGESKEAAPAQMRALLRGGMPPTKAVAEIVRRTGLSRSDAYRLMLEVRGKR